MSRRKIALAIAAVLAFLTGFLSTVRPGATDSALQHSPVVTEQMAAARLPLH